MVQSWENIVLYLCINSTANILQLYYKSKPKLKLLLKKKCGSEILVTFASV